MTEASARSDVVLRGSAILICIGFVVWVLYAWTGYGEKYAMATEGWRLGGTHMVEISVTAVDRENLGCASSQKVGPTQCPFDAAHAPVPTALENKLSPYNTIKNQLLLGAGLWANAALKDPLPRGRFVAVCNFHVLGVMLPELQWSKGGPFGPVTQPVPTGTLSDCVLPR